MWICPSPDASLTPPKNAPNERPAAVTTPEKSEIHSPATCAGTPTKLPKGKNTPEQTIKAAKVIAVSRKDASPESMQKFVPYLLGTAASGVLAALCTATQRESFFSWGEGCLTMFSDTPVRLFSSMFLSAILLLTLLAALGFCAFGKAIGKLLIFFYGIGSGALCLQLFVSSGWRGWVFFAAIPGIYLAILAYCLGHLAEYSAQLSGFLLGQLKKDPSAHRVSGRMLMDHYFVFCSWQIAACGALSTASGPLLTLLF